MRVTVDRTRCQGTGICEATAPGSFEIADDGALVILDDTVAPDRLATVTAAVKACPTEALSLTPSP